MSEKQKLGQTLREEIVIGPLMNDDNLKPIYEIATKYELDDRERLVLAYRVGAKGKATLQQIGDYCGVTLERVRQIEQSIRKRIGKDNWAKLEGTYIANRPKVVSKAEFKRQRAMLRKYLASMKDSDVIQYGRIMDAVGIEYEPSDDVYDLDEIQSCKKFHELYGFDTFGEKYRQCHRCKEIKRQGPDGDFYKVGSADRYYAICKGCNTARCRDYMRENAKELAAKRRTQRAAVQV